MNHEAQQKLNAILSKDISAVTDADRIFLKARASYLTQTQLEKYLSPVEKKQLTYRELYQKGKEKGLKLKVGLKREELEQLVGQ